MKLYRVKNKDTGEYLEGHRWTTSGKLYTKLSHAKAARTRHHRSLDYWGSTADLAIEEYDVTLVGEVELD